jgi:hypothetical protein
MTDSKCTAGINSIGILASGGVVPCLSTQAWTSDDQVEGNILNTSLEEIWENNFKEQRFGCFYCCKDACGNKSMSLKHAKSYEEKKLTKKELNELLDELGKLDEPPTYPDYPVGNPNVVIVYGVQMQPSAPKIFPQGTYVYAVFSPNNSGD